MAFIFVPNADGGFDEGDRQTNPDTGVEYIYVDGAWRALGPDISEEFPELDQRYLKLTGGIMTGGLQLSNARNLTFRKDAGENQFAINPNVNSDYFTNIYTFNSADGQGGVRFRVSQDQNVGASSYDTLLSLSGATQTIGGVEYRGTLSLNRVQTPVSPDQAANKYYVDDAVGDVDLSEYLPLAGGTMTGKLTIDQPRTDSNTNCFVIQGRIKDNSNNLTDGILLKSYKRQSSSTSSDYLAYYGESGGANELLNRKTAQAEFALKSDLNNITLDDYLPLSGGTLTGTLIGQLFKSVRTASGYAFEVKPGDADTKAFVRTDGTSRFSTIAVESPMTPAGNRAFEIKGRLPNNTISKDFFYMYTNNDGTPSAMNYNGKMDSANNLATVGYVNSQTTGVTGGSFYVSSGSLYFEMD